ncbi:MAG: hypothetical protein DI635_15390 [Pseudoxanthomonas suwonensis]|nr:MAG: hypothetical protein DI635_15390 [Pseudoxanthomonas suwonensis]
MLPMQEATQIVKNDTNTLIVCEVAAFFSADWFGIPRYAASVNRIHKLFSSADKPVFCCVKIGFTPLVCAQVSAKSGRHRCILDE